MGRPPTATERDGVWAIVSHEVCLLVAAALERVIPRS
jgi:hypothetical protein